VDAKKPTVASWFRLLQEERRVNIAKQEPVCLRKEGWKLTHMQPHPSASIAFTLPVSLICPIEGDSKEANGTYRSKLKFGKKHPDNRRCRV